MVFVASSFKLLLMIFVPKIFWNGMYYSKILKSAGMDFVERLGPQPEIFLQAHSNLELIWLDHFIFIFFPLCIKPSK